MKNSMLTLAILPLAKAQLLKTTLGKEKIDCVLENLYLPEGTSSQSVRIQIKEDDLENAFPVLEEFLGKPSGIQNRGSDAVRQILVPVDFSAYSLKAARIAFEIARQLNAEMVLFHSYPNPVVYSVPFSDVYAFDTGLMVHLENAERSAQDSMESFLKTLVSQVSRESWNAIETEYIIKAGDARDDILSYANKNQVLLIAMGTQGKAGNEYDIIGSVTAEIITSSKVPVLAIPAETPENIAADFHKVLYATNFDEKDFLVMETLMGIITPFNVEVHCVHIGKKGEPEWDIAKLEGMKKILRSKYKNKTFECQLIVGEDILEELEKYIASNNIDVLSLTTHKRGMLARIINPSIARKMLFHTTIPLLIFHA